ncbi:MAG: DUF1861 family protein [Candidatus Paceibacterota bacterium]
MNENLNDAMKNIVTENEHITSREVSQEPLFAHCIGLINDFDKKEIPQGEKLQFEGVDGYDVYNISAPFYIGDKVFVTGRVEKTEEIDDSQVMLFEKKDGGWCLANEQPKFKMEDGFATHIGDELIIGGVEVYPDSTEENPNHKSYRTIFYRGKDTASLEQFAVGPDTMKDIRLISLPNGKIGVFTRPQGEIGGKGKIGYMEIDSLDDLKKKDILNNAEIIENQFPEGEWGGANELHLLSDGRIGVIGHIAYQDEKGKHYYAMAFIYDPKTKSASPMEIIATRKNFPNGKAKRPELDDIIFPGGLIRNGDGTAILYAGLGDAETGRITIKDPFEEIRL